MPTGKRTKKRGTQKIGEAPAPFIQQRPGETHEENSSVSHRRRHPRTRHTRSHRGRETYDEGWETHHLTEAGFYMPSELVDDDGLVASSSQQTTGDSAASEWHDFRMRLPNPAARRPVTVFQGDAHSVPLTQDDDFDAGHQTVQGDVNSSGHPPMEGEGTISVSQVNGNGVIANESSPSDISFPRDGSPTRLAAALRTMQLCSSDGYGVTTSGPTTAHATTGVNAPSHLPSTWSDREAQLRWELANLRSQ